jgi:hypothetical protein
MTILIPLWILSDLLLVLLLQVMTIIWIPTRFVPFGEFYLKIVEEDVVRDDDIGVIDLTEVMDFDRTDNVQGEDANYDITFFVQSIPD